MIHYIDKETNFTVKVIEEDNVKPIFHIGEIVVACDEKYRVINLRIPENSPQDINVFLEKYLEN